MQKVRVLLNMSMLQEITIKYDRSEEDQLVSFEDDLKTYYLTKFQRTNQGTCINLKPIVKKGDRVKEGTILCEGYATEKASWPSAKT
jgi:DNA-directed RNA polymerase subunit beta